MATLSLYNAVFSLYLRLQKNKCYHAIFSLYKLFVQKHSLLTFNRPRAQRSDFCDGLLGGSGGGGETLSVTAVGEGTSRCLAHVILTSVRMCPVTMTHLEMAVFFSSFLHNCPQVTDRLVMVVVGKGLVMGWDSGVCVCNIPLFPSPLSP